MIEGVQMMGKIMLQNVSFAYESKNNGAAVIQDVNLSIRAGEFVSVIGPSGCGKSTLLTLLAGLNFPSQGRLLLDGQEIIGTGVDRGIVFQHYSLFPWMKARKNITFGIKQVNRDKSKKEIDQIADEYLALVGLEEFGHKYPAQLSGGMQQRVAIARAFAMNPGILLMDEPFSAVDAKNRLALQELLLKLWDTGSMKKTVIFITHDIDEAIVLSDRIIVMSAGNGTVKKEINVEFARPRNRADLIRTAAHAELRNKLVGLLYDDLVQQSASSAAL